MLSRKWLAHFHSLPLLDKRLQPAQHSRPAPVTLGDLRMGGKSAVSQPEERSLLLWLEFPPDRGLHVACPARNPCVSQEAGSLDLQILARNCELTAVTANPRAVPSSSRAQITVELGTAIDALLSPPLQHLLRFNQRLKNTLGRCRDI